MSQSNLPAPTGGEFLLYQTEDGRTRIETRFSGETVCLTAIEQMKQLVDKKPRKKKP